MPREAGEDHSGDACRERLTPERPAQCQEQEEHTERVQDAARDSEGVDLVASRVNQATGASDVVVEGRLNRLFLG